MGDVATFKVHILEGTEAGGRQIFACGRKKSPALGRPYVGRAKLAERGSEVTCAKCREVYAATLCTVLHGGDSHG